MCYLVRVEEDYEMTKTIKFVYIKWMGEGVPFARRGRYSVLQSSISPLFNVSAINRLLCLINGAYSDFKSFVIHNYLCTSNDLQTSYTVYYN